ncbi:HAD family phosphatase [Candidatus Dependentiae bacterium]|nr:HAD family phosphatase [Candidatus Dependentiae bacterium]
MNYKAIIFDMDGTIISSENVWKKAAHHIIKKHTTLDDNECETLLAFLKGGSLLISCSYIAKTFNTKATVEQLMEEKKEFAFNEFHKELSLIEGFNLFHKKLVEKNLKSAIATNASLPELIKILEHIPLKDFFNEHIYTVDHVFKIAKPKPDVYLYAAKQLDIDPKFCIAIEDSAHGINAAKAAGMYCIGINTGKNRSAISHADEIVEHYNEIDLDKLLHESKS